MATLHRSGYDRLLIGASAETFFQLQLLYLVHSNITVLKHCVRYFLRRSEARLVKIGKSLISTGFEKSGRVGTLMSDAYLVL